MKTKAAKANIDEKAAEYILESGMLIERLCMLEHETAIENKRESALVLVVDGLISSYSDPAGR